MLGRVRVVRYVEAANGGFDLQGVVRIPQIPDDLGAVAGKAQAGDVVRLSHRGQGIDGVLEFGVNLDTAYRVRTVNASEKALAHERATPGLRQTQIEKNIVRPLARRCHAGHVDGVERQRLRHYFE